MGAVTASSKPSKAIRQQVRVRRLVDQVGRAMMGLVLILTILVALVAPIQAFLWMRETPFLGVHLEYPATVNREVNDLFLDRTQIGTPVSLRHNDTIVAVEGTPVRNGREVYRLLREYAPGERVMLSVVSDDGRSREVGVLLQPMPPEAVWPIFLIPYIIGLVYLGIGLWVLRRRQGLVGGRVFVTLCASVALALITTFDLWTTHTFVRLWTAAIPFAGAMLLTLALVFPNELGAVAGRPWLRWVPTLLVLPLLAWGQLQLGLDREHIVRAWLIGYGVASFSIMAFTLSQLLRGVFAASPTVREQSRIVLAGTVIAFVPFVLWALDLVNVPLGWLLLAFLLFPAVIAYSITQYSLLDTSRLASFTATYTIMALIVTLGYALLVAGASQIATALFASHVSASNPFLIGLLAFLLVLGFQPLRNRLQGAIDRFFFRSQEEYQERLTTFRHDLTSASSLHEVVQQLKQQVNETLMPTHVYVFLRDTETGDFVAAGEGSRPDTDIRFEPQSGLVHALATRRDAIFLELNKPLPAELVEDHARLAVLRTPVMAPLQGQERLVGWIAVGNKRSGEPFTVHDLRFVQALAEQASLAVERAQAIGDLERRVRELDVLSQVSQAANFTTDPDTLMELVYAQCSKLIDTTNFYFIMHNPESKALTYAFFIENDERNSAREGESWPDDVGLAAEVVRRGRPIRTTDYLEECNRRSIPPKEGQPPRAWMGVPLNAGTTTLGALVVASYRRDVIFTEDHLRIFWAIGDQAATALDKARLFTETEKRAHQLATLNEISKELAATLDLENLLGRIMRSAVEILNAEAGTLFLIDEETGDLVFRVVEGGAQDLVGKRVPAGKGIVGEAASTGEPVISNNVLQDQRWFSDVDRETQFQTQSLLAVPLKVQERSIGVIEVINKRDGSPFDEEDATLLATFAAQAAIAIENARLFTLTDEALAARVDELQNLQRIDRELNRTLKLDRVIAITLEWAMRTTGVPAGAVAMLNFDGTGVEVLAARGYTLEFLEQFEDGTFPLDKGIVGRVLTTGRPEFVENVADDPDFIPGTETKTIQEMAVPILRVNKPIGALVLESDKPDLLTPQDFEFVQRLVEHAAVAIENARLLQEVEEANRSKTEFVSFVAHELKNPMTSIRGYTDLLRSGQVGPLNDMQVQFLSTIRSNVDRMTRLVSDLADVARIETGHLRLEKAPIPVRSVIEETLRGLQSQIEEKNQELILEVEDDLPLIHADYTRMVQVLTNLLSNAHKYTPDGGRIWVGARLETVTDEKSGQKQQVVHHWVRDTGIGMSEEELSRLFTKFFRTQRAKDMAQGTGLGLNITKSLVEWHGGKIWVESEVGAGTTFHYTIPVASEFESKQAAD